MQRSCLFETATSLGRPPMSMAADGSVDAQLRCMRALIAPNAKAGIFVQQFDMTEPYPAEKIQLIRNRSR